MASYTFTFGENVIDFEVHHRWQNRSSTAQILVWAKDAAGLKNGDDIILVYNANGENKTIFQGQVRFVHNLAKKAKIEAVSYDNLFYRIFLGGVWEFDTPLDLSKVVEKIVDEVNNRIDELNTNASADYGKYSYTDGTSIQSTGVTINSLQLNQYAGSLIDSIASSVNFMWWVDGSRVVHFVPIPDTSGTPVDTWDNSNTVFKPWTYDTNKLVNDLTAVGGVANLNKTDYLKGDGSTQTFKLSYIPSQINKVVADGVEVQPQGEGQPSYSIINGTSKIKLSFVPTAFDDNISIINDDSRKYYCKVTVSSSDAVNEGSVVFLTVPMCKGCRNGALPLDLMNDNLKDLKIYYVDSSGGVAYELKWALVGIDESKMNAILGIKFDNVSISAGGSVDLYFLFGGVNVGFAPYMLKDLMTLYFSYDIPSFSVVDSYLSISQNFSITLYDSSCGTPTNFKGQYILNQEEQTWLSSCRFSFTFGGIVGVASLKLYVPPANYSTGSYSVSVDVKNAQSSAVNWVYFQGNTPVVKNGTGLTIYSKSGSWSCCADGDTSCSQFGGVSESVIFKHGIYYTTADVVVLSGSNVTVGRTLWNNPKGNIMVNYNYQKQLHIRVSNYASQKTYGIYSKMINLPWVIHPEDLKNIAVKYLSIYDKPIIWGVAKFPTSKFMQKDYKLGDVITVTDNLAGISNQNFNIFDIVIKKDITEVSLGSIPMNLFEWSMNLINSVRSLSASGVNW